MPRHGCFFLSRVCFVRFVCFAVAKRTASEKRGATGSSVYYGTAGPTDSEKSHFQAIRARENRFCAAFSDREEGERRRDRRGKREELVPFRKLFSRGVIRSGAIPPEFLITRSAQPRLDGDGGSGAGWKGPFNGIRESGATGEFILDGQMRGPIAANESREHEGFCESAVVR